LPEFVSLALDATVEFFRKVDVTHKHGIEAPLDLFDPPWVIWTRQEELRPS
tara:strand:- start:60 stop:212 length:153 start_codon:yes stop_codon:yes gene_type:complete